MSLTLTYNGVTLTPHNLFSLKTRTTKAMVAESLEWDVLSSEFCVWPEDEFPDGWTDITDTSTIVLNVDGELSVFYPTKVKPLDEAIFALEGVSLVGILHEQFFAGALYDGETVSEVLADLLGSYPYTVDPAVASLPVEGYLPRSNVREALRQLLAPYGISIMKNASGNSFFTFNTPTVARVIEDSRIEVAGELIRETPVTEVRLLEHSYEASSAAPTVTLFDNSSASSPADHQVVEFDEPLQLIGTPTGTLVVDSSTINSITVSGKGTLTGKFYLHQTKVLSEPTGVTGRDNVHTITDMWLASPLNSLFAVKRFASYMSKAEHFTRNIYANEYIRSGSLVNLEDPIRQRVNGYIKSCETDFSTDSLSLCDIVSNWRPDYVGVYNDYQIITSDPQIFNYCDGKGWNVRLTPDGVPISLGGLEGEPIRIVLFSGSQGGGGGRKGFSARESRGGVVFDRSTSPLSSFYALTGCNMGEAGSPSDGAAGGYHGLGGRAGRTTTIDISSAPSALSFTFGQGGAGGAPNDYPLAPPQNNGELGEDSILVVSGVTYSTQGEDELSGDYVNMITGETVVPHLGPEGLDGGRGFRGGVSKRYVLDNNPTYDYSSEGKGEGARGAEGTVGYDLYDPQLGKYWHFPLAGGGGAGGSASGSSTGTNGTKQEHFEKTSGWFSEYGGAPQFLYDYAAGKGVQEFGSDWVYTAGSGGNGRNASHKRYTHATFGGGEGGDGGGGGGGAGGGVGSGDNVSQDQYDWPYPRWWCGRCLGGEGGKGGYGQQGGSGFAIMYFQHI